MKVREQAHEPHDVLGVSPASGPERIDAAYHSLIRKFGGRYGDLDRVRTIEAAYDQLKGQQRGHGSVATAEQEARIDTPPMWQVRPRSKLPKATPAPPAKNAAAPALPASPPPVLPPEPSFSHAPIPRETHTQLDGPAARHWTISDWSSKQSPAPASEQATDQQSDDPIAVAAANQLRLAMPLATGLGVIIAALVTQYMIDRSPRPDRSEVRAATAALVPRPIVPPKDHAIRQRHVRNDELRKRTFEARQQPISAAALVDVAATAKNSNQAKAATATAIAKTEIASGARLTRAEPSAPAPASAMPVNPVPAIPNLPGSKQGPHEPPVPPPTQPQAATPPAVVEPARWISGGLQDSDNRYGRFVGAVAVRILVRPNGRAGGCRIAQSSGNPALDQTTCRLLGERLLFSPAQDAAGRPIESEVGTTYVWGRRGRR